MRRASPIELAGVAANFVVAGLSIWIHGRQIPEATDSWDANWLRITAHCSAEHSSVTVSGSELDTVSFFNLREGLKKMRDTLAGESVLKSVEPSVSVRLFYPDSIGHVRCRVELSSNHLAEGHWFEFDDLDQSHLPSLIQQLDAILEAYPVKMASERGA